VKRIIFIIIIIFLLFSSCKSKKREIQLKNIISNSFTRYHFSSNEKLTPEKFFKINIEINKISKKYSSFNGVKDEGLEILLKKRENEINKIYKKYNITEEEFNKYGEGNYTALESYLKKHPEIKEKLMTSH